MTQIINLNRARKTKARAEDKAQAAANRVRFGRTKAEKAVSQGNEAKAARRLDQTKREP